MTITVTIIKAIGNCFADNYNYGASPIREPASQMFHHKYNLIIEYRKCLIV